MKDNKIKHRFKVGDKVTYKYKKDLPHGVYSYNGACQGGFVGTVRALEDYTKNNYRKILVSIPVGGSYGMSENEFLEYDKAKETYQIY